MLPHCWNRLACRAGGGRALAPQFVAATVADRVPVFSVDLVADGEIAHALREFERAHLIFGIGLGVNRIGRAEEDGANAELAGEKLLSQIELELHVASADGADVGMSEGVIPDFVALAVDAFSDLPNFSA